MNDEHEIGKEMGAGDEFPFDSNEEKKEGQYTRDQLMKMTGKELAKIAEPMQKRFTFSSLKSKGKPYLCDIILGVAKEEEKEPQGKATQSTSESEDIITMGLQVLQSVKMQREGQGAVLNPIAQEIFKSSAVNEVDKARAEGTFQTDNFNKVVFGASAVALAIDGLVGFNNVPALFSKIKGRLTPKAKT